MPKDTKLYELLEVSPTAGENEIRKAYYKMAKLHHPDKLQDTDKERAEEKFKEIKFAYEVLSDKQKRDVYDRYGLEGLKDGVGGTEFEDIFSHLFGGGGMGGPGGGFFPFDLFGGGMGGMGGGRRQAKRRTQNMVYPLKVTLEELYMGATKNIELERSVVCAGCEGTGGKAGATKPCGPCSGRGFVMQYKQLGPGMVQQIQAICKECMGEGELINEKDRCKQCNGKKTIKQKKTIEVHVDKGMHDSQKITHRGESNQEVILYSQSINYKVRQNHLEIKKKKWSFD
jgi:DnaJ family protein A protein 2